MISSVSDYVLTTGQNVDADHPHGDLDRIRIDGGIMPLRDDPPDTSNPINAKRVLRGEDIAFLAEALAERCNFWTFVSQGNITNQHSFSLNNFCRRIVYDYQSDAGAYNPTPRKIAKFMSDDLIRPDHWYYNYLTTTGNLPTSTIAVESTDENPVTLEDMLDMIYTPITSADITFDYATDFPSHGRYTNPANLKRSRIEALFSTLSNVNGVQITTRPDYQRSISDDFHIVDRTDQGTVPSGIVTPTNLGWYSKNGDRSTAQGDEWATDYVSTHASTYPLITLTQPQVKVDPESSVSFIVASWDRAIYHQNHGYDLNRHFWTISRSSTTDPTSGYVRAMASACGVSLTPLLPPDPTSGDQIYTSRFNCTSYLAVTVYTFGSRTKWTV